MGEENQPKNQLTGPEFEKMRQDVLRWIEKIERRENKKPLFSLLSRHNKTPAVNKPNLLDKTKSPLTFNKNKPKVKINTVTEKNSPTPIQKKIQKQTKVQGLISFNQFIKKRKIELNQLNVPKNEAPRRYTRDICQFFGGSRNLRDEADIKFKPSSTGLRHGISAKANKNKFSFIKIITLLIFILIGFLIVMSYGIYAKGWRNNFTIITAKIIPYPAIIVNGKILKYSDYVVNYNIILYTIEKNENQKISNQEIKSQVIDKMISDEVLFQIANEHNAKITNQELNFAFSELKNQLAKNQSLSKIIKKMYNCTVSDFESKILLPYLTYNKLNNLIKKENGLIEQTEQKAIQILKQIKNNEITFDKAQELYNQADTAGSGGDLGYIARDQINKNIENILFSLSEGEVSSVIKMDSDFYIFKVDEIITDTKIDAENFATSVKIAGVKARQIHLNLDNALLELIDKKNASARISVLIN